MSNVIVVGSQWGDEGKGKIVDWLSERADYVVRFQGGHNAGHTLVIDGKTYALSLLPSGIVREGKVGLIGNGVVVDPWALFKEIELVTSQGLNVTSENLKIAENAPLILPLHVALDKAREIQKGAGKIGTTGRGIGPAYEDKIARRAVRAADILNETLLRARVAGLYDHYSALAKGMELDLPEQEDLIQSLLKLAPRLKPFLARTWEVLHQAEQDRKRLLFEGAQGAMLDIDHGTYPFVTSSNTLAANAALGSGYGNATKSYVLGITKAYTTRVGSGPFPTEDAGQDGQRMGERGREFGTVTGRQRRCGWFDAVMVRQAAISGGITGMALTKLDVLDGFETLNICVAYDLRGERLAHFPSNELDQADVTPIYESMPGWHESTYGAQSYADLPANAVKYVRRLEELVGIPAALLSTSPKREDTILMRDPFEG